MHLLDKKVDLKTQCKNSGGRSNAATGHQDVKIAEAPFIKLAKFIRQVCGSSNGQQPPAAGRKRDADALEETAGSASVGERGGAAATPLGSKQTPQEKNGDQMKWGQATSAAAAVSAAASTAAAAAAESAAAAAESVVKATAVEAEAEAH